MAGDRYRGTAHGARGRPARDHGVPRNAFRTMGRRPLTSAAEGTGGADQVARVAGIKDVARQAGVSVGTVSNVINRPEAVLPETRARVLAAIEELGYVRSESARQLRAGRSRIMALLVLDMGNPFFVDVARGAERAAREAGLGVMVCNSGQSPAEEAEYLGLFAEQRVCGVLVTPADATGRNLEAFSRHHIPFVLVDRVASSPDHCAVSVDDVRGGSLAVGHLLTAGHRSVAYVSGPGDLHQIRNRREGALSALDRAGLGPEALVEIPSDRLDVAAGRDAGVRLLGLVPRPTAVFCANDLLALGVLQSLYAAGVRVPQDIAIVGYDDIEFAAAAAVPLTSVRQPAVVMGRMAADLLLQEADDEDGTHEHRSVVLQPELVVRASSATPR